MFHPSICHTMVNRGAWSLSQGHSGDRVPRAILCPTTAHNCDIVPRAQLKMLFGTINFAQYMGTKVHSRHWTVHFWGKKHSCAAPLSFFAIGN